jgi:hypothetical protein
VFDDFFDAITYTRAVADRRFCINEGQTISVFGTTPHYEPSNFTGYGGCPNNLEYCPGGSCAIPYNIANQTIFKAYKEANEKIHYCLYGKSKSSSGALLGLSIFGGVAGALLVTCVLYHCCKKERNSELRQNLLSSDKQGRFPLIVNNDSIAYMP